MRFRNYENNKTINFNSSSPNNHPTKTIAHTPTKTSASLGIETTTQRMNALHARRRLPDLRHFADALIEIGPHRQLGLVLVRQRQLQRFGRRQATGTRQCKRISLSFSMRCNQIEIEQTKQSSTTNQQTKQTQKNKRTKEQKTKKKPKPKPESPNDRWQAVRAT